MSKILFLGNIYVIPNTFSRVALLQLLVILFELARLHEDDVVDGRKVHSCALNLIRDFYDCFSNVNDVNVPDLRRQRQKQKSSCL